MLKEGYEIDEQGLDADPAESMGCNDLAKLGQLSRAGNERVPDQHGGRGSTQQLRRSACPGGAGELHADRVEVVGQDRPERRQGGDQFPPLDRIGALLV